MTSSPVAYYNECDPFAAQWLKNLIAAKLIAHGDVDERSIEDVYPVDLIGYTQCHFFRRYRRLELRCPSRRMARFSPPLDRFLPLPAFLRGRQKRRDV